MEAIHSASGTPASAPPGRILVVDDETAIVFALQEFLATNGYPVDCAAEKEEAEALILHRRYALVIADLRMTGSHGREGLDLVQSIKHSSPDTMVILLTAYGSPELEAEALRRGAAAFLHKPKPLLEIGELVSELLGETP